MFLEDHPSLIFCDVELFKVWLITRVIAFQEIFRVSSSQRVKQMMNLEAIIHGLRDVHALEV
jgi:hypothetical protein